MAKDITELDYPLDKIQRISSAMMAMNLDEFDTDANNVFFDFSQIINNIAKDAQAILKELEDGNAKT